MIEKRFLGIVPRCIAIIGREKEEEGPNVVLGEKYDLSSSLSSRSCSTAFRYERRARLKTGNERGRAKITARNTRISAGDGTGENRWYGANGNA